MSGPPRGRIWWRLYFFLMLGLIAFGVVFPLYMGFDPGEGAWWDWLHYPFHLVQALGLFGFAFWRRIALASLWKAVFTVSVVYVVYEISATYDMAGVLPAGPTGFEFAVIATGLTILLEVPLLVALYLYGFRCRELWQRVT